MIYFIFFYGVISLFHFQWAYKSFIKNLLIIYIHLCEIRIVKNTLNNLFNYEQFKFSAKLYIICFDTNFLKR